MEFLVKKLDGRVEPFSEEKLRRSLLKAGADSKTAGGLVKKTKKILFNGIETKELFNFVLAEFKKIRLDKSSKYNLKNAIMGLGRHGYVFEKFVAKILEKKGYSVQLNQDVKGTFVSHEIDVVAKKGKETVMVECKYHHLPWLGCSIQTALYVFARFLDVREKFGSAMLVTNTRFSRQVIKYSKGVGLRLMGWNFPPGDGLEFNIEKFRLYPVTILFGLGESEVQKLLENNIIVVSDVAQLPAQELAEILGIRPGRAQEIILQAKNLIG